MIDLLYVAFNRRRYAAESFEALIANTDWDEVGRLLVHDDGSTDGTDRLLRDACADPRLADVDVMFHGEPLGGPVAAMNWALDQPTEAETLGKIDCDFVTCPGWLPEMQRQVFLHPEIDAFGMAPMNGLVEAPPFGGRAIELTRHIGGIGLIRHRAFERCRPTPRGRYGWTEYQHSHPGLLSAWIYPDLPCFELDRVPLEPWQTLAAEYVAAGWQRRWPPYDDLVDGYWSWWQPSEAS